MISRSETFQEIELNIVGSSTFGKYPKISIEKTYNMFISDGWLVGYAGYKIGIPASRFGDGLQGRAIHASTKLNKLVVVIDDGVFLCTLQFDQRQGKVVTSDVIPIGNLQTSTGIVYIAENNKPQILFSDNATLYCYDTTNSPMVTVVTTNFVPGYIDFHDTYFLCAASSDGFYTPPATNTWRLSDNDNGLSWPDNAANIGLLETKPDNTQAVVRFPGKGNMVYVMGKTVSEPWYDVGYQLFPYTRSTSSNSDFGCLNPATIASLDKIVVWLGINEKAGPVIMYSEGGEPKQISTDGINYLLSNMQTPQDSQGFLYMQDGHLFYHINFYADNVSLFYDFNTDKFFHACDENNNYFIASSVAFFQNQYYFISRNNGNLYAFDTIFSKYDTHEIPRTRTCKAIRNRKQEYFIANDLGFTIESGETPFLPQDVGPIYLTTEDGNKYITDGDFYYFTTESGLNLITEDGNQLVAQQPDTNTINFLISEQDEIIQTTPRVDLSISTDGGEHFSSYDPQYLPGIGYRKNKLMWWQLGAANDMVPQFRFWGMNRLAATDGVVNIRQ